MKASLAAIALGLGLVTAIAPQASNTTDSQVFTIVPNVPVLASTQSQLETPATENIPSTYTSTGTSTILQDYGNTGPTTTSLTSPPPTYGPSGPTTTSTSLPPAPIVHTEKSHESLLVPTVCSAYPEYSVCPPAPIALTKYTSVAHPTLPTVYSSPIALTKHSSVAKPTLPVSQAQTQGATTYEPLIVHTEVPAESLAVPSSQTYTIPGPGTTHPVAPIPGADEGQNPGPGPRATVTVPTTLVTLAPEVIITMGGYQSTGGNGQAVETTIPEQVMTMSGGEVSTIPAAVYTLPVIPVSESSTAMQPSSSEEPSGTAQPEGYEGAAAARSDVGLWRYSVLGMVVGAVVWM